MTKQARGLLSVVAIIAGLIGHSITAGASTVLATSAATAAAFGSGAPERYREKPDHAAETIIQFGEEGEPRTSKSKAFSAGKWRPVSGDERSYVICPGRFFSDKIASCREYSPGFLGFIGHSKRVPALPIEEYLEKEEQKPIRLNRIELREGAAGAGPSLMAHYHPLPGSGPAPVTEDVQTSPEGDAEREAFRLGSVATLGVTALGIVLVIMYIVLIILRSFRRDDYASWATSELEGELRRRELYLVRRRVMRGDYTSDWTSRELEELRGELRRREQYLGTQVAGSTLSGSVSASPPTLQDYREIPSSPSGEVTATNSSRSTVQEERVPARPGYRKIILDTGDSGGRNE